MSITIHHGANGSYKTSAVIQDYFIPAALSGRTVVTNIRGVSAENTYQKLEGVPDGFEVIFVDTKTTEGKERIKRWFHWVPVGALLLFDEAGSTFPKAMSASEIKSLDYEGGADRAKADNRPLTWIEAWQEHRHWNWDIVLSCPNIKSVRDDIRETTEGAYKHKNLAVLGSMFKGKYNEGYHSAADNGTSSSHFTTVSDAKKIKPIVFELYESTATGKTTDTLNGGNIFMQVKVLLPLVVAVAALGYSFTSGGFDYFIDPTANLPSGHDSPASSAAAPVPIVQSTSKDRSIPSGNVPDKQVVPADPVTPQHPLKDLSLQILGFAQNHDTGRFVYWFELVTGQGEQAQKRRLTTVDLNNLGYTVTGVADCLAQFKFQNIIFSVSCLPARVI